MSEPVAYLVNGVAFNDINRAKFYSDVLKYHKKIAVESLVPIPLYTAEQLHQRVKMTKQQYDRLMWEKTHTNLLACMDYFFEHDDNYKFGLSSENLRGDLTQEDIARAWLNPEETIEIVPDMKWFVRSIVVDDGYYYYLLKNNNDPMLDYEPSKKPYKEYMNFDTKEEAELWTNPLTEAVQLPVEDE